MGFDTLSIFILFGVKVPNEDILKVIKIFFPNTDEVKRPLIIPNTTYLIVKNGEYFISLKSIRFELGFDDHNAVTSPVEIVLPTQEQVNTFLDFLGQNKINYHYGQYFLP